MTNDGFWIAIDNVLDRITNEKPSTYDGVKAILDTHERKAEPDAAFFAGSGGDRTLREALDVAGWEIRWSKASYFYAMLHPDTNETLTYVEGDVLRGSRR